MQLYTKLVEAHQREHAAYEAKRAALRPALMAAEEARLAAEEEAAAAEAASRLGGMKSWLSAALGAPQQQAPVQRTRHQRAVLARAVVERQLDERLGPAPAPPPAPKGGCRGGVRCHGRVAVVARVLHAVAEREQLHVARARFAHGVPMGVSPMQALHAHVPRRITAAQACTSTARWAVARACSWTCSPSWCAAASGGHAAVGCCAMSGVMLLLGGMVRVCSPCHHVSTPLSHILLPVQPRRCGMRPLLPTTAACTSMLPC